MLKIGCILIGVHENFSTAIVVKLQSDFVI